MERKRRNIFQVEDEPAEEDIETSSVASSHHHEENNRPRGPNNQNFRKFQNTRKPRPSREEYERKLRDALNLEIPAEWYPKAREIKRKFVYHCGPTNSGKTYAATEAFMKAKRGIYCCPLRLQAAEIQDRCTSNNVPCDLLTGEEHWFVQEDGKPADHMACTIYMASHEEEYDVAVVDEIQNISDRENGYAWTRAILGLCAKEIHVCGEETGIELVNNLIEPLGDDIEIEEHERDSNLIIERRPLGELRNVQDGDCIVCFRKKHVRKVVRELNRYNKKSAKIYGTMPPAVKKEQSRIFNDPDNPTTVLVATDAIGQGLNLAIRRIVFYELRKTTPNEYGEKKLEYLDANHTKHIAGRAGRKNLNCGEGKVTALYQDDLRMVTELLSEEPIDLAQAGLQPPVEKLVEFAVAYKGLHPEFNSYNMDAVLDKFKEMAKLNRKLYFLCALNNVRQGSEQLKSVRLNIEDKFKFCTAPVPSSSEFLYEVLRQMAEKYSRKEKIHASWLKHMLEWENLPWSPRTVDDLEKLESASHAVNLYLWLGNKFDDYFPDFPEIDDMQERLLKVLKTTVENMADLRDDSGGQDNGRRDSRPPFNRRQNDRRYNDRQDPQDRRYNDRQDPQDRRYNDRQDHQDRRYNDRQDHQDRRYNDRRDPQDRRYNDRPDPRDRRYNDQDPQDRRYNDRRPSGYRNPQGHSHNNRNARIGPGRTFQNN